MVNVYFSLYLCGDRPKNEKQKNNGKESIKSVCILNKRHKNKKKVVEEVDFTNKEVEEDDKEEEGAERARGKCNTFLLFCFVSSFVVVVEKQPSAFCTLSLARSLTSCSSLCLSRFPMAAGRWCRSRRRRGHPALLAHSRYRTLSQVSVFLARAR